MAAASYVEAIGAAASSAGVAARHTMALQRDLLRRRSSVGRIKPSRRNSETRGRTASLSRPSCAATSSAVPGRRRISSSTASRSRSTVAAILVAASADVPATLKPGARG